MTRLFYPIKEIFVTLQGEGTHAGARAVFVRTAGCNVWTGREEDRARDVTKGCCAAWCDTDFRGTDGVDGGKLTASDIATKVRELWGNRKQGPLVVISGGEPSLVIDDALVAALHAIGARVHVETNGSNELPASVDWVTLSPKPPMPIVDQRFDEVKVVLPAGIDPLTYVRYAAAHFVQPLDSKDPLRSTQNLDACLAFVHLHPEWRLSLQTHKITGVP